MDFVSRVLLRSLPLPFAATLLFTSLSFIDVASAQVTEATPIEVNSESAELAKGLDLERARMWSDAIRHYEKSTRQYPISTKLYQRLVISRLHHDVNRRFLDETYKKSLTELSTSQALDLYSEILANLQTHYVGDIDWARVQVHGTAALEVALTEKSFLETLLPGTDIASDSPSSANVAAIETFRQTIHHRLQDRNTSTRFDLRANAAFVAEIARTEIGMSPTATVLEFLSGAVSTLDPYTRLLSPRQLNEMFNNIEGNFVGLGIELKANEDNLQILSVIPKGPAEEAGILAGEKIVGVEASRTDAVNPDFVADLLRGPEHSYVTLSIIGTDGKERRMNVQRRRVEVPCVENVHFVDVENRVGYLRLTNFQKTTTRDVEKALWKLHREGMRSLVIDVRGNPRWTAVGVRRNCRSIYRPRAHRDHTRS